MDIVSSLALCIASIFMSLGSFWSYCYLIHALIVNFLVTLDVNAYLVYSFSIIGFGCLGFFLTYLVTCCAVVLIVEYRTVL